MLWRRSYDVPPPPLSAPSDIAAALDPRYAGVPPDALPSSECLKDVVVRMLPYWYDAIVPDLLAGRARSRLGARELTPCPREAPRPDSRRGDRRAQPPDRRPPPLRARHANAADRTARSTLRGQRHLPRPRRGCGVNRGRQEPRAFGRPAVAPAASAGRERISRPTERRRVVTQQRGRVRARAERARQAGSSSPTRCRTTPRPSPASRRPPRSDRNRRSQSRAT